MALSPNYSWAEPDNSSLVKNGAADIRTLGDAIDTSVWNVGYGQAGKNKIINGNFAINQRGFTSTTANGTYTFDRFLTANSGGTSTYTAQTFTAGTAPVAGYNGKNFIDVASTGQTLSSSFTQYSQRIEDVYVFAGQTVTVSFWAKAASGTPKVAVDLQQFFGEGASASVNNYAGEITTSTSWVRYSLTTTLASLTGKTIIAGNLLRLGLWTSAGSDFSARGINIGLQTATISFWGVQVEYGSKATPFQTATGTIQGELAACQRYYCKSFDQAIAPTTGSQANGLVIGKVASNTIANNERYVSVIFPVTMRTAPTVTVSPYTTPNNSGRVSDINGTDLAANSGTAAAVGQNGFAVFNNTGGTLTTVNLAVMFHYQAAAEL